MHWPEPLRDETLYSWLARMARLNAMPNDLTLCNWLTGSRSTSIMNAKLNLAVITEKADGFLGTPKRLLRQLTAFHVAAALGDVESCTLANIESGDQSFDLTAVEFGGMCRWRICPDCVADDIALAGIAWWHRTHQLPTSLVCATHGTPLQRFDVKRHQAHEHFILPIDFSTGAAIDLTPVVIENLPFWNELATLGKDALDSKEELPSLSAIHDVFIAGLRQQGLVTRGGNLRQTDYAATFAHRAGHLCAPGMLKRCDAEVKPMSLIQGIWPSRHKKQPLIRLLLVQWLYGSWRSYLDRCHWEAVLGSDQKMEVVAEEFRSATNPGNSLEIHRDVCREFLGEQAAASRSTFWRAHPRNLRWLNRHDADWLDFQFLHETKRGIQRDLFD